MKIEEKYNELIIKYLDKTISQPELKELLDWLKTDKNNFNSFIEAKDIWNIGEILALPARYPEFAFSETNKLNFESKKRNANLSIFVKYLIPVAATLLLMVLLSVSYFWLKSSKNSTRIAPISYTQFDIPKGHKGIVTLPDGTKIWLNSNTTLKYKTNFDGNTREIYLNGEAYLDVAKDPKRPFLVETSKLTLKVLGTSFNVKCYNDENTIETTLIEGSLKIMPVNPKENKIRSDTRLLKEITLRPNEKATLIKNEGIIHVDRLDIDEEKENKKIEHLNHENNETIVTQVESIISWKDNELIFKNETLEEVCHKIERWYGISVQIKDENLKKRGYRYNGKFVYNETINQVMDILARTTPVNYTFDKNILVIKEKTN